METRKKKVFSFLPVCLPFAFITLCLSLVSCGESPVILSEYKVVFYTGEGYGAAPFPQTVAPGNVIELPGQENMKHSTGKVLSGWKTGGTTYDPYDRYTVNGDVEFTAQWSVPKTNPGSTTPDSSDTDDYDDSDDNDDSDDSDDSDDDDDDDGYGGTTRRTY